MINHIIIQAGGKGSRLGDLTKNKPKALVSVRAQPLIISQMKKYPSAHFYIIADWKKEVLKKYLKIFAPFSYTIIIASDKQTCSGIQQCLKLIPENVPLLILWCDLYFEKQIYPKKLQCKKKNYIGLSGTFPCRWKFENGNLLEEKSSKKGVAGVFVFKNKKQIGDIPKNGELCVYLKQKRLAFLPFTLQGVKEIGTIDSYTNAIKQFANSRPFNSIVVRGRKVIKRPLDQQGKKLAKNEITWYKAYKDASFGFIPRIFSYAPLTMQKIQGSPLFQVDLTLSQKKNLLTKIVYDLELLHGMSKPKKGSYKNNHLAILGKTRERLRLIAPLIPDIHNDIIVVNGKECINFYKKWSIVEKLLSEFFAQEYVPIHGDNTFSNTLYNQKSERIYFIDPRGYFGKSILFGDKDYDWAKLYYSLAGNYDQFNRKNFNLTIDVNNNTLLIGSNKWEGLEDHFFTLIKSDPNKIRAYHAIIWLSLTSYAWDDYDSICGAFYKGIYLMQELYEKTL